MLHQSNMVNLKEQRVQGASIFSHYSKHQRNVILIAERPGIKT